MECHRCKSKIREGARFCSKCGAIQAPAKPEKKEPEKRGPVRILIIILIVAALLAGIFLLFSHFGKSSAANTSDPDPREIETIAEKASEHEADETEAVPESSTQTNRETMDSKKMRERQMSEESVIKAQDLTGLSRSGEQTSTDAAPAAVSSSGSRGDSDSILYIREVYSRTVQEISSQGSSEKQFYNYNGSLVKVNVSNEDAILDDVMKKNGYGTYSLDYYYDDNDDTKREPIFIFAVIDGKEYRYYFKNGDFIRRIGPDGTVNDNPEINDFVQTVLDTGTSYR